MRNRIKITVLVLLLVMVAVSYGLYQYTRKPADIRGLSPEIEIEAVDLVKEFKNDEAAATSSYVDEILLVRGEVSGIQTASSGQVTIFLEAKDPLSSVTCSFYGDETIDQKKIIPGKELKVKGKCTGMLSDVIINKCSVVE